MAPSIGGSHDNAASATASFPLIQCFLLALLEPKPLKQGVFVCPYFYKVVRRRGTKIHATCKVPHLPQRYFQNTVQCPQGWDKMAIEIAIKWVQIKRLIVAYFETIPS